MSIFDFGRKKIKPAPLSTPDSVTLKIEPVAGCGTPSGVVAYLRMPLKLTALEPLSLFVAAAYGPDCVTSEDPKGWLKISTPAKGDETR